MNEMVMCPKCGSNFVQRTWHKVKGLLECHCNTCGAEFETLPLDVQREQPLPSWSELLNARSLTDLCDWLDQHKEWPVMSGNLRAVAGVLEKAAPQPDTGHAVPPDATQDAVYADDTLALANGDTYIRLTPEVKATLELGRLVMAMPPRSEVTRDDHGFYGARWRDRRVSHFDTPTAALKAAMGDAPVPDAQAAADIARAIACQHPGAQQAIDDIVTQAIADKELADAVRAMPVDAALWHNPLEWRCLTDGLGVGGNTPLAALRAAAQEAAHE